jgi:hypothetical protein
MNNSKTWGVVVLYATAMAWVEAAVVFYLRTMIDRIEPYQATPLPVAGGFGIAEMMREVSTMVMLLTVGFLAGRTWRSRIGYSVIAFGVWDIFYYVFLKVMTGWPHSLLDWDILFLIPLPWWGPVLAPVMIAALMIVWGTFASQLEDVSLSAAPGWKAWLLNGIGIMLALYVFMTDALRVSGGGVNALRELLPVAFNWRLFLVAWLLMAAPVMVILRELWNRSVVPLAGATGGENPA